MRMIDADKLMAEITEENPLVHFGPFGYAVCSPDSGLADKVFMRERVIEIVKSAPTVDATSVVRGFWKEVFSRSMVSWKDGKPVWADRAVYRCSECDFGTIIKHNYCPRCGANNEEASPDGDAK